MNAGQDLDLDELVTLINTAFNGQAAAGAFSDLGTLGDIASAVDLGGATGWVLQIQTVGGDTSYGAVTDLAIVGDTAGQAAMVGGTSPNWDTTQMTNTIEGSATGTYTLDAIVTAINTAISDLVNATDGAGALLGDVASAAANSVSNQFWLRIEGEAEYLADADITATTLVGAGGVTYAGGGAITSADLTVSQAGALATLVGEAEIDTQAHAEEAITLLDAAISTKDIFRAQLGYMMNRLEAASSVIDIQAESLLVAESRISDVDVATEMAAMTRNQVLAQAGISMLAQANAMPQMALKLLG